MTEDPKDKPPGTEPEPAAATAPEAAAGSGSADDFLLAGEALPPPAAPPTLPTPAQAAMEAARLVSEMVDIHSESGAVIAAAAAAGAAIEAAVAAAKGDTLPSDPLTTVRLSRERILRALESEDAAATPPPAARTSSTSLPRPSAANLARTTGANPPVGSAAAAPADDEPAPSAADDALGELDPVALAAAAISRLRHRARTDLAELRVHYQRHDGVVVLLALALIIFAGRVHARLVAAPTTTFDDHGLTFTHTTAWLAPEAMPPPPPRLLRGDAAPAPTKTDTAYHVELTSTVDPSAKIEVLVDKKPAWSNIVTGLELDRRTRWGELYSLDASDVRSINGHDWLRTAYRYAHVVEQGDVPRIDRAVEFATIDRDQIYVLTFFGSPGALAEIEDVVAPTLAVQSQTGLPLVPQTGHLAQRTFPGPVGHAFESTVMVVVADLVDGRLKARGGGSGVIVGGDGSILTNYHVIHDRDGRLHDVFVIGRFSAPDQAPQLVCAGRPNRSKLQRERDLALLKCDLDLDGKAYSPAGRLWPTLAEGKGTDVKIGEHVWVLGYPDVGGGGLTLSQGEVEGFTGEDGAQGTDFIKTNAAISHGNSGGPVVDDAGRLVGVASAFRTRVTATGGVIETAQVGLVRPLGAASDLLAYAGAGWTPLEGHTEVEIAPTAVEASTEGVRIYTTVADDATDMPIRDALVMVLRPGVSASAIDMNRLDDQAIAWGKTNNAGEVRLKQLVPTPGTYTVMVVAPSYEPLIGESELHLTKDTPASFDPWGRIGLRSR